MSRVVLGFQERRENISDKEVYFLVKQRRQKSSAMSSHFLVLASQRCGKRRKEDQSSKYSGCGFGQANT